MNENQEHTDMEAPAPSSYDMLIQLARNEDFGNGDMTSAVTIPEYQQGQSRLVFRETGIVCGMPVAQAILRAYDTALTLDVKANDGTPVEPDQCVGIITGPLGAMLAAERVILNFLQRLSAIATQTAIYVKAVQGTAAQICDTRKTTPGWRELEKYAVRCGGGWNHRHGLYDAVLIKDNHLAGLGGNNLTETLRDVIQRLDQYPKRPTFIEVEVDTLAQLQQVLEVPGVDMILLDNMDCQQMSQAVQQRNEMCHDRTVLLEASGGVTLDTVGQIAATGVDRISIGALTHTVRNLDIGLDMEANADG